MRRLERLRGSQVVKGFEHQTDFIFNPGDDKEPLDFTEWGDREGDIVRPAC